ncbi:MAG TPA: hypothetical protein DC049_19135 [Spirochaetia bacterium]|nr:hypothetical protein [Spirochaetia bacterium]
MNRSGILKIFFSCSIIINILLAACLLYYSGNLIYRKIFPRQISSFTENIIPVPDKPAFLPGAGRLKMLENSNTAQIIRKYLEADERLELTEYPAEFTSGILPESLRLLPGFQLYVLCVFSRPLDYKGLLAVERADFETRSKIRTEYLGKKHGIFFGAFRNLKNLSACGPVSKIYILSSFTARGYYKIICRTMEAQDRMTYRWYLPHSRPGKELLERRDFLTGDYRLLSRSVTENIYTAVFSTSGQPVTLYCELLYYVQMEEMLKNHVLTSGHIKLADYYQTMQNSYPELYGIFTKQSEKIKFSPYVDSLAEKIKSSSSPAEVWRSLSAEISRDIRYDYEKRRLFFSGQIVYTNIADMYMPAPLLGEKKIGACPESSSLEAAVMRRIGIAARTATRAGHVYAEVFTPQAGWLTTSLTINEIPLCVSTNEEQSYFVHWEPYVPAKVVAWESLLYPRIQYE